MSMLGATDRVVCPIDDLVFRPYYTDGECPLCCWQPDQPVGRPWWKSADPVWSAFLAAVAAAVLMVIVVVAVYANS